MTAIVGRKVGMTQLFDEAGHRVPVTLVEAPPNVVVAVKTRERHGYEALQVGVGEVRERRLSRPVRGVYAGARVTPQRTLRELRGPSGGVQPGQTITVEVFRAGDVVDVTGTSRGRGFAGAIKRHGFAGQRDTHGVSLMHRAVGSIGSSNVGRVWPGKRMPGRFGSQRVTVRGLHVVKVEPERNLIYLRGAVPGVRGGLLLLRSAQARGRAARKRAKGRERA